MQGALRRRNKPFLISWTGSPARKDRSTADAIRSPNRRLCKIGTSAEVCALGLFFLAVEPPAAGRDLSKGANQGDAVMTHWNDTMVDRPESDGVIYVTGWSISGLVVLGAIFAVWIFGI
jgi:hypothetical protein